MRAPRRVVTGHDANGKSVVVSDGPATRSFSPDPASGLNNFFIWSSDVSQTIPASRDDPTRTMETYFPPLGGTRFFLATLPPGYPTPPPADRPGTHGQASDSSLSMSARFDSAFMHETDSVDYIVVLSGMIWQELDDGVEILLQPGDCLVQNGTWHGWRNRGQDACVLAIVVLGVERSATFEHRLSP
jgi:mannose-6-phosphate isomerase-like protein (cupin superfamily)